MPYRGTQSGLWWRQRMDQHNILCKISSQIIVTTCQRPAASDFLAAVYSDLGEDGLQQFVLSQHFILATAALAAGHSFCSIIYTFNPGSAAAGEVPLRGYGQQFHGKLVCSDQIELGSVWRITLSMMLISVINPDTRMQYYAIINDHGCEPCYRLVLSAPNTDLHHPFKLNLIDIFSGSHFFQSAGDHILVCPLGDVALLAGHLKLHALPATNDLKKHHAEAVDIYLNSYRRVLTPLWREIATCAPDSSEGLGLKPYGSTMQYAKFKMKSVIFQGDVGEVTQSVAQDETKDLGPEPTLKPTL
uniref:Uncharacterized protein n=2 Tax=Oryza meridionalis TaxID=40149 RepID=A0A0E0EJD5_9ORYZ